MTEYRGFKVHRNIQDIQDDVDLAVLATPAASIPEIVEDCAAKDVKFVHIYTAGFSEIGSRDGIALEARLREIARNRSTRIIGPNSMGVHCPAGGISWAEHYPKKSGRLSVFAQSGSNAEDMIMDGGRRGIYINKLIGYGNGCDLNESDFLDYFGRDPETGVIAAYMEGAKDGRRFLKALKTSTQAKPVIILKGGNSQAGTRAARSHTASMAGEARMWNFAMKQAGAISVKDVEELIDATLALQCLPDITHPSVAIISVGKGGGNVVLAADTFERAGFQIPPFSDDVRVQFGSWINRPGVSLHNPVDISKFTMEELHEFILICAAQPEISLVILSIEMEWALVRGENIAGRRKGIIQAAVQSEKPFVVVMHGMRSSEVTEIIQEEEKRFLAAGIPCFRSIQTSRPGCSASGLVFRLEDEKTPGVHRPKLYVLREGFSMKLMKNIVDET